MRCVSLAAVLSLLIVVPARSQAVKRTLDADTPSPPISFRGVVAGRTTSAQVRDMLGPPQIEGKFYSSKLLYRSTTRPDLFDSMTLLGGKDGIVTSIEAATINPELATAALVTTRLGPPEYALKWHTQTLADYSAKGVRFIFDSAGRTIGIVYLAPGFPRVHEGARRRVDLSGLPAAPPPGPAADFSSWRVGAAVRKITPLEQEWLPKEGWKVHDDLLARAVYITDGKTAISLVGADLFGMSYGVLREVIAAVRENGCGELILAMSHNHAAPDTIGVYGHFPAEYIQYLGRQMVDVCAAAKQDARRVGSVRAGLREMPLAGGRVHGWFRNARNPGILDPRVAVLRFEDTDGKIIASVVHFACHVEGLEDGWMDISADFPGYMCARVQQDLGGVCVFLNGALGGMVSGDQPFRTHEEARQFGLALADELTKLARTAPAVGSSVLKHARCRLEIPTSNPRLLSFASKMETDLGEKYLTRGRAVTEMHYIQIGSAQLCTIPGELLPEISFEILETMKGYPQMIVGLVNDEIGYIIPAEDFRAGPDMMSLDGWDYEETMSLGPAAGPVIKEYARRIILENQTFVTEANR